jgi:hypothetical protein
MPYNRYLGVGEEATFGQAAAISRYIDVVSESIKTSQGWITPETVDSRFQKKAILGPISVKGSVNVVVEPDVVPILFKWLLGSVASQQQGTSGVYDHSFTPADSIKSFTAELGYDTFGRKIVGCLINAATIESVAKKELVASFDIVAKEEQKITSLATPTFSARRPFVWSDAAFKVGASDKSSQLRAFSLKISNNIPEEDLYAHGSRSITRVEVGEFTVEGALDLTPLDTEQYDRFLAGQEAALNIKFTGESTGVQEYPNYTLEIDLPRVVYESDAAPHLDGKKPLKANVPFKALYDPSKAYAVKIVVRNKVAGY